MSKKRNRQLGRILSVILSVAMLVTGLPAELLGGVATSVKAADDNIYGTVTWNWRLNQENTDLTASGIQGVNKSGTIVANDSTLTSYLSTLQVETSEGGGKFALSVDNNTQANKGYAQINNGTTVKVPLGIGNNTVKIEAFSGQANYDIGETHITDNTYTWKNDAPQTEQGYLTIDVKGGYWYAVTLTVEEVVTPPTGTVIWDFKDKQESTNLGSIQNTTGEVVATSDGVDNPLPLSLRTLSVDATSGKLALRNSDTNHDAQFNSGTIIKVPLGIGTNKVTVVGRGSHKYDIDGTAATADSDFREVVKTETGSYMEIKATSNGYLASITLQVSEAPTQQAEQPTAEPATGQTFTSATGITLTSATEGAKIYYTTNGDDPTTSSPNVESGAKVKLFGTAGETKNITLKAMAVKSGYTNSDIAEFTYTINRTGDKHVTDPVATPSEGTWTQETDITLSTTTDGADIYYTIDGKTPSTASTKIAGTAGNGGTSGTVTLTGTAGYREEITIKAYAVLDGRVDSAVKTFSYVIDRSTEEREEVITSTYNFKDNSSTLYTNSKSDDGVLSSITNMKYHNAYGASTSTGVIMLNAKEGYIITKVAVGSCEHSNGSAKLTAESFTSGEKTLKTGTYSTGGDLIQEGTDVDFEYAGTEKELTLTFSGSTSYIHSITVTQTLASAVSAYPITVGATGMGEASADHGTAEPGTEITLTATPYTGYYFSKWEVVSGDITITDNKFMMPASAVSVNAVFEANRTKWDFANDDTIFASDAEKIITGATGTVADLEIDATNGKWDATAIGGTVSLASGTIVKIPVEGSAKVTINANKADYTINDKAATAKDETFVCQGASNKYVTLKATADINVTLIEVENCVEAGNINCPIINPAIVKGVDLDNIVFHDSTHGFNTDKTNGGVMTLHLLKKANVIITTCAYGMGANADVTANAGTKGDTEPSAEVANGTTGLIFTFTEIPAGEVAFTFKAGGETYIHSVSVEYISEEPVVNTVIDVWDFGAKQETDAKYSNKITAAAWKEYASQFGGDKKIKAGDIVFGDLTYNANSNERLYTTNADLSDLNYDSSNYGATFDDGYESLGAIYNNGAGSDSKRYLTLSNVAAGDKIVLYANSSSGDVTYHFTGMGTAAGQDDTAVAVYKQYKKIEFVAEKTGTYKIWSTTGKPMYHRVMRVPAATVTGSIKLGECDATDYNILFVNKENGKKTTATLSEDKKSFEAKLAPGYQYVAVFAGVKGWGVSEADALVDVADDDYVSGKNDVLLRVVSKPVYTFSGKVTGFATDYDTSNLKVILEPSEESNLLSEELELDDSLKFSTTLQSYVDYTIVLKGVNDYKVKSDEIFNKDADYARDIEVVLNNTHAASGNFIGLGDGVTVSSLKFKNVDDNYEYDAEVKDGGYTINLRDGSYQAVAELSGSAPFSTKTHVVVDGGDVAKDLLFVSTKTADSIAYAADIYVDESNETNHYATVRAAVEAVNNMAPAVSDTNRVTIHIAPGTYREQVIISKPGITLKNDDPSKEVLLTWYYGIGYKYYSSGSGYYDPQSAFDKFDKKIANDWGTCVLVQKGANEFRAEGITFENSFNRYVTDEELADGVEVAGNESITFLREKGADVQNGKAVERAAAIVVKADKAEFKECTFLSSQDTVYIPASGQHAYFTKCKIEGQTDYIFGEGSALFDACELSFKGYSTDSKAGYITAHRPGATGDAYLFRNCTITGNPDLTVTNGYLGRNWGADARVYFMNTKVERENIIVPKGWYKMADDPKKSNFYEYNTKTISGDTVDLSQRERGVMTEAEAAEVTATLALGTWVPSYYVEEESTVTFTADPTITANSVGDVLYSGDELTVNYSLGAANDANDTSVIKWYRVKDGTNTPVKTANATMDKTYKVTKDDAGATFMVEVTPSTLSGKTATAKTATYDKVAQVATFTVTFVKGNGAENGSLQITDSAKITEAQLTDAGLNSLQKAGYEFICWMDENSVKVDFAKYEVTGNVTLTALWKQVYIITVDKADDSATTELMVTEGNSVTKTMLPDPEKENAVFVNWVNGKGQDITIPYKPTGSDTLTAKWREARPVRPEWEVTINRNDGTTPKKISVYEGEYVPESELAAPERHGYVFDYWYADSETENAYVQETPVTKAITLTAHWTEKPKYTVTLNADNGTDSKKITVIDGDSVAAADIATPEKQGFIFKGWKIGDADVEFPYTPQGDVEFKAVWEKAPANSWVVTVDKADGSAKTEIAVTKGEALTADKLADPTRENYTFKGWTVDGAAVTLPYTPTADVTITATWEENKVEPQPDPTAKTFKVTIDKNNNTVPAVIEVKEGSVVPAASLAAPTKSGYTFAGWYADKSLSKAYNAAAAVTEDITIYAKWSKNTPANEATHNGEETGVLQAEFIEYGGVEGVDYVEARNGRYEITYTGDKIKPAIIVTNGLNKLTESVDYTVKYTNNQKVTDKAATVVVTGKGNYSGKVTLEFWITKADLQDAYNSDELKVGGTTIKIGSKPAPVLVYRGTVLTKKDYDLSGDTGKQSAEGTVQLTASGKGNFKGDLPIDVDVKASVNKIKVTLEKSVNSVHVYNGEAIELEGPSNEDAGEYHVMDAKDSGKSLTEGVDYEVSYGSNVNAGKAKVTFIGIGDYSGSVKKTFKILPAKNASIKLELGTADGKDGGYVFRPQGVTPYIGAYVDSDSSQGAIGEYLVQGVDYKVTFSGNKKAGTAKYKVTFLGNYKGCAAQQNSFTIEKADLADADVELYNMSYVASKKTFGKYKQDPIVLLDGVQLNKKEYSVVYTDANDNVLTGKEAVSLAKDESMTVYVKVVPKSAKSNVDGQTTAAYSYEIFNDGKTDISKAKITLINRATGKKTTKVSYTGAPVTFDGDDSEAYVQVVIDGQTFTGDDLEKNFDVKCYNNIKKGKATLVVTADSDTYCGTKTIKYSIVAKKLTDKVFKNDANSTKTVSEILEKLFRKE